MPRKAARALWAEYLRKAPAPSAGPDSINPGLPFRGVVLGVDPSLRGTGLALVQVDAGAALQLLHSETLRLPPRISFFACLGFISEKVEGLLERFAVDHVALEQTIYVQNVRTAQILGAARGAAIAPAARAGKEVFEYPPLRVKQAIVGFGRASKEQLGATLRQIMRLEGNLALDESDAAGVAVCHAFTYRAPL